MPRRISHRFSRVIALLLCMASLSLVGYSQKSADVSKESARSLKPWVRDGVIYEIFPRAFSPEGNFNGITNSWTG